jgi:hypothetical protein
MREGTSTDSTPVLLDLDTMPGPAIPAVGDWPKSNGLDDAEGAA